MKKEDLIKAVAKDRAKNINNLKGCPGKPGKPTGCLSDAQRYERLQWIADQLTTGQSYNSLRKKMMERYGMKYQTANNWIKQATEIIRQDTEIVYTGLKDTLLNRLDDIYNKAIEDKDKKTAIMALKQMQDLSGVAEPIKQEVKLDTDIKIDFGIADNLKKAEGTDEP